MELRHLRYFAAVAETRHFGRAAGHLHLAQPALSQSIRQLEKELGAPLLTRTTRHVSLTPAGEFLHTEALRILAAVEAAAQGVSRLASGRSGLVRVAFTGTAAHSLLPRIARIVRRDLPDVALEIHADLLTPAQTARLRDGSVDLGVLRPPVDGADLAQRTIEVEPLLLAVPADHPLATADEVGLADLRTEDFIGYADSHSAVNEALLATCRDAGFLPRIAHEATGTSVLLALVSAGLGVSLVPASVRSAPLEGVVFRHLPGARSIELALAWRAQDAAPAALAVLATLERAGLFPSGAASDMLTEPIEDTPC